MKNWILSRLNAWLVRFRPQTEATDHLYGLCEEMRQRIREEKSKNGYR